MARAAMLLLHSAWLGGLWLLAWDRPVNLLWLAAFQAFGLYAPQHLSPPEEFRRIFGASGVGIVLLVVASYWSHSSFSRLWMGATWVLALVLELVSRRAWRHHQLRLKHRGRL